MFIQQLYAGVFLRMVADIAVASEIGPSGSPVCPCIGLPSTLDLVDCSLDFAVDGQCVVVSNEFWPLQPLYPSDYGGSCKKHFEPAESECFDTSQNPSVELAEGIRESWCDRSWCYVDPENCVYGTAESNYWPGDVSNSCLAGETSCPLRYSYETCGQDGDLYDPHPHATEKRNVLHQTVASFILSPILLQAQLLPMLENEFVALGSTAEIAAFLYNQRLGSLDHPHCPGPPV
jgi:hypothetical protein